MTIIEIKTREKRGSLNIFNTLYYELHLMIAIFLIAITSGLFSIYKK